MLWEVQGEFCVGVARNFHRPAKGAAKVENGATLGGDSADFDSATLEFISGVYHLRTGSVTARSTVQPRLTMRSCSRWYGMPVSRDNSAIVNSLS